MSEWKEVQIGDVCKVGDGAHAKVDRQEKGVLYLTSKNFSSGYLKLNDVDFISEEDYEQLFSERSKAVTRLQSNDVLMGIIGTFGNAYKYKETDFFGVSSSVAIIRPQPSKLNSDFLVYLLNSEDFRFIHRSYSSGSVQGYSNIPTIKSMPIIIPSVRTQEKIVSIFKPLDRKISNLRQQNETLEAIAQTLFKHWFVDFEFPNEDGKPYRSSGGEMVRSELGEIPASWHIEPLKKCLTYLIDNRGKTPTFFDIGIPALSAKFVKGGDLVNRDSFNYVSYELFEQSEKLEVGDIILTSEAPLGETYFIAKETRYYPAQRVFALRANPEVISCSYLNYWFSSTIGQSLLQRRASGSTVQGIKQSELYQCEVIFPAKRIQNLASDAFMKALLKREANSKQIQILTKIRDALLPNLMNGKVRIKS